MTELDKTFERLALQAEEQQSMGRSREDFQQVRS